jgi:hypothetical protein
MTLSSGTQAGIPKLGPDRNCWLSLPSTKNKLTFALGYPQPQWFHKLRSGWNGVSPFFE